MLLLGHSNVLSNGSIAYFREDHFSGGRPIGYSYHRPSWFGNVAAECRNTAEKVTLFDQSCFVKYRVEGPDALKALNWICAAQCDVAIGRVVYTQWLNDMGGIEADVTVTRLAEDGFMIVTVAASQRRDLAWFKRHVPGGLRVHATDITSGLAMFALMGPKSRELMSKVSPDDFSNDGFPFGTSKEIDLGYARARVNRLTFVGELGYEIYVETEFAAHVHDRIVEAGKEFGLTNAGFFTLNSLRMEKGYRHWGHDIGEEDTPYNGGVGFAVALEKEGGFIGQEALRKQKAEGPIKRRLVQLKLSGGPDMPMLYHNEPIYRDGNLIGSVTSGAYGHRVEASLGLGYVTNDGGVSRDFLSSGNWEVEIAMKRYPIEVQLGPWYDAEGRRIKA